ncbi:hypothetical protein HYALB_00001163 [Hymenoscyphus albidus]|uniref:FAD-binding domain-containing protein n=1 Tax=Hymenoscyphus albidus TaxID=595503 RepID=A0A9N9LE79_9HELO|nr:hypothetical protein HYALB_00001163 [Hymenoscyphus albidus]
MPSNQPRIAIVGGGPAGLTAGVLLHQNGIPFTVFELRHKPAPLELAQPIRMLDLHEESGLAAIRKCVSRSALNELLVSKLPGESIKWGHKLLSATTLDDAEVMLDFGEHGKQVFDLVIGADGAWSKIRSILTSSNIHNSSSWSVLELSLVLGGDGHAVTAQRGAGDTARIYVFISTPDVEFGNSSGLKGNTVKSGQNQLLTLLDQWGPKIKELVTIGCEEETENNPDAKFDIRPDHSLPIDFSWNNKPGVTIIGDAAHLMPPSGECVNIAMWDAVMLTQAVIKAHEQNESGADFRTALSPLVKDFEVEMQARAKQVGEESANMLGLMFSKDGPLNCGFFQEFFLWAE